jgi:uncharacterized protein (TIRG00374 family)
VGVVVAGAGTPQASAATVDHRGGSSRPRYAFKALSILCSGLLLMVLYQSLDLPAVGRALRQVDPWRLALAIGLIAPITVLRALRFRWLNASGSVGTVAEAVRITLVASALNVFLPAKTGDFAKSLIVARRGGASGGVSAAIVVYERLSDTACIIIWGLIGAVVWRANIPILPSGTWLAFGVLGLLCLCLILSVRAAQWLASAAVVLPAWRLREKLAALLGAWSTLVVSLDGRRVPLLLFSVLLWFVQIFQIWVFALSLSAPVSFAVCASVASIALIVGQIPGTLAGIGSRDMTLVLLLSAHIGAEKAAALGILTATRTFVPALLALPILRHYLRVMVDGRVTIPQQ